METAIKQVELLKESAEKKNSFTKIVRENQIHCKYHNISQKNKNKVRSNPNNWQFLSTLQR